MNKKEYTSNDLPSAPFANSIQRSHRVFIATSIIFVASFGIALAEGYPDYAVSDAVAKLWPYHAGLMIIGFLLLLSGMSVARNKNKGWLKRHKALGLSGASFAIAGFLMALYMISEASQEHFTVPHAYVGAFVIFLLILTPLLGFAQFRVASRRSATRKLHRRSGRLALVLMAVNISFGLWLVAPI